MSGFKRNVCRRASSCLFGFPGAAGSGSNLIPRRSTALGFFGDFSRRDANPVRVSEYCHRGWRKTEYRRRTLGSRLSLRKRHLCPRRSVLQGQTGCSMVLSALAFSCSCEWQASTRHQPRYALPRAVQIPRPNDELVLGTNRRLRCFY